MDAPRKQPTNIMQRFLLTTTGVAQRAPGQGITVPAGCTVYVRGHNGTNTGNVGVVKVATDPDNINGMQSRSIAPNTQIPFPVSNTRDIVAMGTAADGIEISIIGG